MPTTLLKKTVQFDNRVQAGEVTRDQLLAAYQAAGFTTNTSTYQKDPVTHALNACDFFVRGATAEQVDSIEFANPGVIGYISPLPPPLQVAHAESLSFTQILGGGTIPQELRLCVAPPEEASNSLLTAVALIYGNGTSNPVSLLAGGLNPNPSVLTHSLVLFLNPWDSQYGGPTAPADIVITDNSIVITHDGSLAVSLRVSAPFTIPAPSVAGFRNFSGAMLWVGAGGELYKYGDLRNGIYSTGPFSYAQAVANGAL